jgi:hypothetical protein
MSLRAFHVYYLPQAVSFRERLIWHVFKLIRHVTWTPSSWIVLYNWCNKMRNFFPSDHSDSSTTKYIFYVYVKIMSLSNVTAPLTTPLIRLIDDVEVTENQPRIIQHVTGNTDSRGTLMLPSLRIVQSTNAVTSERSIGKLLQPAKSIFFGGGGGKIDWHLHYLATFSSHKAMLLHCTPQLKEYFRKQVKGWKCVHKLVAV